MKKILFKLSITAFIILLFLNIYPKAVYAQGPMTDEIVNDMLSIGAFTTPLNPANSNTEDDIIKTAINVRPSVVQIQVGKEYGSGSIFSITKDHILIITAGHVVKNWNSADNHYVIFYTGKIADAELIATDESYDAAILSVATSSLDAVDVMNLRSININPDILPDFNNRKNQVIITLDSDHQVNAKELQAYDYYGNDTGIGNKYVYGTVINPSIMVSDYGYKMIYVKCDAHPGMSGGGVFDITGNYVGILVGGTDTGEMVAVKLSDILDIIETATKKS